VEVRGLTPEDAVDIAAWRYPGREATYDVGEIVTPEDGFWAVEHEGELMGYCCFGPEARVPGVQEQDGTLDVGYGMRPERVGQGLGRAFVGAIVAFGVDRFEPERLRVLILDWNLRSRRVAEALSFQVDATVTNEQGTFVALIRPVAGDGSG
jgi:RimJ/RimL family protein N-acetyltransferase